MDGMRETYVAISAVVRAELIYMALNSSRRESNLARVHAFLSGIDALPIDNATAQTYAEVKAALMNRFGPRERAARRRFVLRAVGVSENDLWIAATALSFELAVVSADEDFHRVAEVCPLRVECWRVPATGSGHE